MNRRSILFGWSAAVVGLLPVRLHAAARRPEWRPNPLDDAQPGDMIEVSRWPKGYQECGLKISKYQVQPDLTLKKVGADGRWQKDTAC